MKQNSVNTIQPWQTKYVKKMNIKSNVRAGTCNSGCVWPFYDILYPGDCDSCP